MNLCQEKQRYLRLFKIQDDEKLFKLYVLIIEYVFLAVSEKH